MKRIWTFCTFTLLIVVCSRGWCEVTLSYEGFNWTQLLQEYQNDPTNVSLRKEFQTRFNNPEELSKLSELSWSSVETSISKSYDLAILETLAMKKIQQTRYGNLIQVTGLTNSDRVILQRLKQLKNLCEQDKVEIEGLDSLIRFVNRWISPDERLEFFGGTVRNQMDYDIGVPDDSPLYPLACFYRGRMIVWTVLEYSGIYPYPEKRARYLDKAIRLFTLSRLVYPENRVIHMYLGKLYPPEKSYSTEENAPDWAIYQREALERLTDVIEWWIDNRFRVNGEYGGGWGDDCEMWRHWIPVLVGFDDPKINWAQSYFSKMLLQQPHLQGGYHNRMSDVEHTAEDLSDALTPMMHLQPNHPDWKEKALRLIDLMKHSWTGINQRGLLQFKSTYFTANDIDLESAKACDTVYHPRALQPALLYWQRTHDERVGELIAAWMDTWVDVTKRAEKGKPKGVIPTAIHWPDGSVGGVGENWWEPENYSTPLYDFPSAMYMMTKTLLLTYHMTGNEKYLDPIRSMAKIRLDYLSNPEPNPTPGSKAWCGMKLTTLSETIAKYRFLTGDQKFDELLAKENLPYLRYRLFGDKQGLVSALKSQAQSLRYNFPSYTREVRFTDRVFRFPILFEDGFMFEQGNPLVQPIEKGVLEFGLNTLSILYQSVTGDPGNFLYFPMNAVCWHTSPRNLAALVVDSNEQTFEAELYNFEDKIRSFEAEFYFLQNGNYKYELIQKHDATVVNQGTFTKTQNSARISLQLPVKKLCELRIVHIQSKSSSQ